MKKKTKTVIGVILAVALVAVLVVVGFMTYLGIRRICQQGRALGNDCYMGI